MNYSVILEDTLKNCDFWGSFPNSYNKDTMTLIFEFTRGNVVILNSIPKKTNNEIKTQENKTNETKKSVKPSPKIVPNKPKTDLEKSTDYFFE